MNKGVIIFLWALGFLTCLGFLFRQIYYFNEPFTISNALAALGLLISSLALYYNILGKDDSDSKIEQLENKIGKLDDFNTYTHGYIKGIRGLELLNDNLSLPDTIKHLEQRDFGKDINLILDNLVPLNDLFGFIEYNLGKKPNGKLKNKYKHYRQEILFSVIKKVNIYTNRYLREQSLKNDEIVVVGHPDTDLLQLYTYAKNIKNRLKQ